MLQPQLDSVYAWKVFVPGNSAWVHFRRSEMHGPGWWFAQASTQDGRVLATRTISAEHAADLYARYGEGAEVQLYS
jgi:hypothetical protein